MFLIGLVGYPDFTVLCVITFTGQKSVRFSNCSHTPALEFRHTGLVQL